MTGASGGGNGGGGTSSNCPTGSERCACYGNNTCDQGFECRSNLCVTGASGGSIGTGGTSSSGGASTGGNTSSAVGTGGATTGGTDPTSTGCAQQYVPIQVLPPDIMIILDRSMSMTNDVNGQICTGGNPAGDGMCGTEAKWYKSIVAIDAVVQATQASVNWGLWWLGNEPAQCGSSSTPAVAITPGASYDPIMRAINSNMFNGAIGTPTAAVIKNSLAYVATVQDPNPKFLLLAIDGEPNCADGRNIGSVDANGTVSAITAAFDLGIPTFVIGIATTSVAAATMALNSAAQAGGYPQQGAATQYYAVSDTETLKAVLSQIIGLARSCVISLENTPVNEQGSIAISATDATGTNVLVPNDATNGWAYTDTSRSSITLVGSACASLKNGAYTDFKFVYTCARTTIIND